MSRSMMRNVAMIVALAAVVAFLPGGGTGAGLVDQSLSAAFVVVMALAGGIAYRRYRRDIFGLGDQQRTIFYASLGTLVVALAWTRRLFDAGGAGVGLWMLALGAAVAGLVASWQAHRAYGI